ncbi:colicin immunity domain-containing protein [Streptomyces sp. MB09-01]|uniref:colicin immunity domain-containing protein n=1 Tax=Streptomyces sp. MB09-01 TaxID=3028666 RepID=UPI0029B02A3A|nr:colicin immunity domain-containing protein [Streptomyces sp. MB09-01]MDX3534656.1 colicin immunity domain-containing protein [Streptomyces sp. MB09-01]
MKDGTASSPEGRADLPGVGPTARRRQWRTAREVPEGSGTGRRLDLMRRLSRAEIRPERFAEQWLDARRDALDGGERIGDRLCRALNEVFYALDAYPIDPDLRETGDTTDAELLDIVNQALEQIDGTGSWRWGTPPSHRRARAVT